ncbi:unnamed protein product [Camellia sinensis]
MTDLLNLLQILVNLKPKVPTKAVCAEHLELRKEILTLLNLQKQILIVVALGFQSLSVLFVSNGGMLDNDTSNGMMRNLLLSFFLFLLLMFLLGSLFRLRSF